MLCIALASVVAGCAAPLATSPVEVGPPPQAPLIVEGLAACTPEQPAVVTLDPAQPLVVIVHGCFSSGGAFRSLAEVFEFHGQQTVCFNYDDRASLRSAATRLRAVLDALAQRLPGQEVVLLGHSQGGMISRIALGSIPSELHASRLPSYRLVTVSSPLAGIRSARHCGLAWFHFLSLGITTGICQAITGSDWPQIHPRSAFWRAPDSLASEAVEHLIVVTDEEGSCRRYDEDGSCVEDDYVFSVGEQANALMLADPRARMVTAEAGHVEIVGEHGDSPPEALIDVLQAHGVMAATPPHREVALRDLLERVFVRQAPSRCRPLGSARC